MTFLLLTVAAVAATATTTTTVIAEAAAVLRSLYVRSDPLTTVEAAQFSRVLSSCDD